jgi:aryl-alcohol dehydrogenase-like predicted oxidoreductase
VRYLDVGTTTRISRIGLGTWQFGSREWALGEDRASAFLATKIFPVPGASSLEQVESNVAAADIDLKDEEYQALSAASARFRPVTGPAALPRLVRAQFT